MPNNNKREPKKTWYWVPFTGAILISIIAVSKVIYMKTPKVGPWTPPDTGDLLREVGWGFLPIPPKRYIKGVFEHPPKKGNSTLAFTITVAYKNKRSKRL